MNSRGQAAGQGRTAEIRRYGESQVIKLCRPWVKLTATEAEKRNAMAVHSLGLPVPVMGELV